MCDEGVMELKGMGLMGGNQQGVRELFKCCRVERKFCLWSKSSKNCQIQNFLKKSFVRVLEIYIS